ncbi:MAG: hypothetical protein ACLFM0_11150 [Spirochaetales bacterium]
MADYEQLLSEARERITNHENAVSQKFQSIGRRLYENPPASLPEDCQQKLNSLREVDDTIQGYDSLVERIQAIDQRRQEIREQREANDEEIRSLLKDSSAYYESIGEAAYEYFRRNQENASGYEHIFEALSTVHDELSRIAGEINTAEQELAGKSFFDKVVVRGRLALLRTRQANKEGSIPKHHYRIGERIVETGFAEHAESSDLNQALEPYRLNQRRLEEIRAQQAALDDEDQKLQTELEEAGVTRKSGRRVREIESLRSESQKRRTELLEELGKSAFDSDEVLDRGDADRTSINELREAIAFEYERIERLQAALEADRLDRNIEQLTQDIEQKNRTISDLKKEITAMKKQKTELSSQRDAALQRRGDVEDLEAVRNDGTESDFPRAEEENANQ